MRETASELRTGALIVRLRFRAVGTAQTDLFWGNVPFLPNLMVDNYFNKLLIWNM
jgi:hypothetical protein